ncbi:MAG: winged helix DNA-binding domain-containing protein [Candidatus Thorarchaeota archaeon]
MEELTLEQVRLNHLRKQHALDKKRPDFYKIAKAQLGLHSTDYWTPYLSVWARIGDYDAEAVFKSLNSGDRLLRLNAFRTTVHVVHIDNLSLVIHATKATFYKKIRQHPDIRQLSDQEIGPLMESVLATLEDGPKTMREIKKLVPENARQIRPLFHLAATSGKVVRATASHARSSTTSYALLEKWIEGFSLDDMSEADAVSRVIHRYIDRFGPISINDLSWWLPTTKTRAKAAVEALGDDVVTVQAGGTPQLMTPNDFDVATSLETLSEPVIWLLPYEDFLPKAFIDRSWYLSDEMKPYVFPKLREHYWPPAFRPPPPNVKVTGATNASGEIRPSIWINGELVGRWEFEKNGKEFRISYRIFQKVHAKYDNMISDRARELEDFVNTQLVPISKTN